MSAQKNVQPPQLIKRFFTWYCGEEAAEDLVGDMDEIFYQNLATMKAGKARRKYWRQAIVLLFSFGVKIRKQRRAESSTVRYHSLSMYRSYGKIAFRNLAKQKSFSLINMVCLSVGMSIGLLAVAVWLDVREVDDFHVNRKDIYRVISTIDAGKGPREYASTSAPLTEKLKQDVPGIDEVVELNNSFNPTVVLGENGEMQFQGYYASESFLEVFTFPLAEGDMTALDKPFSVVLTREAAGKLFRSVSPIGKVIEVKNLGDFVVTGLLEDHTRSHFDFEMLASYSTLAVLEKQGKLPRTSDSWGPVTSYYSYFTTKNEKASANIQAALDKIQPVLPAKDKPLTASYSIQPLSKIPSSDFRNEIGLGWGDLSLYLFFFLALLVLLPACFNYANIAIARAMKRAKEIGLRKVSGGEARHIFFQMLVETVVLSVISLSGAVLLFIGARNGFLGMVAGGTKIFDLEIKPVTLFAFLLFGIFTGIAAGIFPAYYFSGLNPIETLRNASQTGRLSKISIRKALIVGQFVLSLFFILSVTIVFRQYQYALNYNTGFQKENILDIPLKNVKPELLETELRKIPEVSEVSMASALPGNWQFEGIQVRLPGQQDSLEVYQMFIDQNYIRNLELKLVAGKSFDDRAAAQQYVITNETMIASFKLGTPAEAIGKSVLVEGVELRILGVVKDFNYMPLQEQIRNFFFRYDATAFRYANVKLSSKDITTTLDKIGAVWNRLSEQPFEAKFLDDELEASLVSYKSMIKIFGGLGILAITISCLGLLAVVISAAESRIKEMGIRKILGATVPELAMSLSKSFLFLIGIAILIATPLTYFIFDKIFLRLSYYRGTIGVVEIVAGVSVLLLLVAVIIGSQTIKVSKVNPVDTLKYE